jgi:hypothetical protein
MCQKFFYLVLLFIVLLAGGSCDFPGLPPKGQLEEGQASLTVKFPGAGNGRSVLQDDFIGGLTYEVTFTGPGGTVIERTVEGGSISLALDAGEWAIEAKAFVDYPPGVPVGSGGETVTLFEGRYESVTILMYVDPAYERTLSNIYIHNEAELRRIGTDFAINGAKKFYLERDIVLTEPWTPIGGIPGGSSAPAESFKAVFDGQGHSITIRSFSSEALSGTYLGLFGRTGDGADIKNLTIVYPNLTVTSSDVQWLGGLVGSATATKVSNVHVLGTIEYTAADSRNIDIIGIGGLVGGDDGSSGSSTGLQIYNSSFTGTLKGTGEQGVNAGGILGSLSSSGGNAKIETSYAAGIIHATSTSGDAYAGGIAGNGACSITDCYSAAEVAVSAVRYAYAGGIIGQLAGSVTGFGKCYALGSVSAGKTEAAIYAGGIAGRSGSLIENCVALAEVDGKTSSYVGRIIGDFWSGTSSETNYAAKDKNIIRGSPGSSAIDGDYTSYGISDFEGTENQSKYTDLSWTFNAETGWKWLSPYPYPVLGWQTEAPDVTLDSLGLGFTWP